MLSYTRFTVNHVKNYIMAGERMPQNSTQGRHSMTYPAMFVWRAQFQKKKLTQNDAKVGFRIARCTSFRW